MSETYARSRSPRLTSPDRASPLPFCSQNRTWPTCRLKGPQPTRCSLHHVDLSARVGPGMSQLPEDAGVRRLSRRRLPGMRAGVTTAVSGLHQSPGVSDTEPGGDSAGGRQAASRAQLPDRASVKTLTGLA